MKLSLMAVVGLGIAASAASAQISIQVGGGSYTSIAGQGGTTAIAGVADDSEHNITSTVGNALFPAGSVRIGNNGVLCFGIAAGEIGFTNAAIVPGGNAFPSGIPNTSFSALAALWDDHFPSSGQSGNTIHWREDAGVLTVEWLNEDHFSAQGTGTVTFQVQVYSSGPVLARMFYPDMEYVAGAAQNFGGSATVGVVASAATGETNVQYTFNTPNAIPSGTVLEIVPAPGAAALLGLGGLVAIRRRR